MRNTLKRIIYKHYLTGILFLIWSGISMAFGINDIDVFWGSFLIIIGCSLAWSERNFIKDCNKQGIE